MKPVVIGRIGGPHGVGGAIRVTSATQPPENIERYRPWLVGRDGDFRPVDVEWLKPHGRGYVARLTGIADRDAAQALAGALIAVARSALPEPEDDDEYYWQDLIGMTVVDADGGDLGIVDSLIATGAHDVLVIRGGEQEVLIPFVAEFVRSVDAAGGRIEVEWREPV